MTPGGDGGCNTLVGVDALRIRSDENGDVRNQPSLWVQTVLYGHTPGQLESLVRGLRGAASFARRQGSYRSMKLAFGDSSPRRMIDRTTEDELAASLQSHGFDSFQYVFYDENRGSAGGQNTLFDLRDPDTDYVFVMNPDVYLCPDVLCELLVPFSSPEVGIVEARQLPLEHPKHFDSADGSTSWASGACMMVRSEVLDVVHGFDADSFFLYCDDVDFSWRTRLAGYRVVLQPPARVYHDKRLGPDGRIVVGEVERFYSAEASLLMAWKYSRPDLVESWTAELEATREPQHLEAVEAFRERQRSGRLPTPIDPEGRVAEFIGHYYGAHRFDARV